MKRSTLVVEAFVFALFIVATATASAQSGSLTLGSGTGLPGKQVQLPIYLNLPRDQPLERILAIIEHPVALSYHRAEVAKEAQANDIVIEVKESAPPTSGKRKRLEITLKGGMGKSLQTGMIGTLTFTVDPKARPQMASLPIAEARGFPKGGGAEVKMRGDSGGVTIYEPGSEPAPLVACFFFTH